jgi:uncharacterized iron-regulated protein
MQRSITVPGSTGGAPKRGPAPSKFASLRGFLLLALLASLVSPHRAAAGDWVSPHYRSHPLAGTIWNPQFKQVAPAELEAALSGARFVLLGEIHDNPDHHRLQAQLLDALVKKGRRPAVVIEMIPPSLQPELDRAAQGDAGALGKALRWEERGWPEWSMYQPIAQTALAAGLRLVAGGLDADVQKAVAKAAPQQLYEKAVQDFGLAEPLKPEIAEAESQEIEEGHCKLLPRAAVPPMLRVQRALDASLANAMMAAPESDGAVLIAGAGHVRKDWAVPLALRLKAPGAAAVSVAFVELDPERTEPSAYMKSALALEQPFDFIYLTPRMDLTDHCAELKDKLKAKEAKTPSGR